MKKKMIFGLAFSLLMFIAGNAQATTITDDFNDGNLDGWVSLSGFPVPTYGNWQIVDGVVIETGGSSDYPVLALKDYIFSDQTVEVKTLYYDGSVSGLTIWWQDTAYFVKIFNRYHGGIVVLERVGNYDTYTEYPNDKWERIWRTMKVEANGSAGEIKLYLDGDYMFTHTVQSDAARSGLTGFTGTNGRIEFDDFKITTFSDTDNDGIADDIDNCPSNANPGQENFDLDTMGDVCDTDDDNDNALDSDDCAQFDALVWRNYTLFADEDGDGITTGLGIEMCIGNNPPAGFIETQFGEDNCPLVANPNQEDFDNDATGDICDADDDNDGVMDAMDCAPINTEVAVLKDSKACQLWISGINGKGILNALGLQKLFNPNSQAGENAGKKK